MKKTRSSQHRTRFTLATLAAGALTFTAGLQAAEVAHYTFDEGAAPYADSDNNAGNLTVHASTDAPGSGTGVYGLATQLQYTGATGTSTCLTASSSAFQTTSFSFSFFIKPVAISSNNNFLMKETSTVQSGGTFLDYDWRLSIQGSGAVGALQLTDRGNGGASGFGEVNSGSDIPFGTASNDYYHVAGTYDASAGTISLYVRDVTANGTPDFVSVGADKNIANNDSTKLDVGTAFDANGNPIFFAASTYLDDLRIYNTAMTEAQIAALEVPEPGNVTAITVVAGLGLLARQTRRRSACEL